jgi:uncharacterized protein YecE (DUF72 family)
LKKFINTGHKIPNRLQNIEKQTQKFRFIVKAWRKIADINLVSVYNVRITTLFQESHDGNTPGRKKVD